MKEITVTVVDPVGLHARPATVAVNAASKFKSDIQISYKGKSVNMKSIMGVMSLGIPTQSEITISADGDDEEAALETIKEVLQAQNVIG
ncbi:phosphocarrier protein HPr [Erysipelothrix urinaevulpis]|uniref:phosphocarrier protein HPr n=1 Tax=Erysipelothrix urinaevulpis TaxID=2683717 RepID=UPI001358550B|nr:phosphocarrier protein HPr [Erysipelothrix urinaevulpis]